MCGDVVCHVFGAPGDARAGDHAGPPGMVPLFAGGVPGAGAGYPPVDADIIAGLKNKRITNPVILSGDPYRAGKKRVIEPPGDHTMTGAVCAVRFLDDGQEIMRLIRCAMRTRLCARDTR